MKLLLLLFIGLIPLRGTTAEISGVFKGTCNNMEYCGGDHRRKWEPCQEQYRVALTESANGQLIFGAYDPYVGKYYTTVVNRTGSFSLKYQPTNLDSNEFEGVLLNGELVSLHSVHYHSTRCHFFNAVTDMQGGVQQNSIREGTCILCKVPLHYLLCVFIQKAAIRLGNGDKHENKYNPKINHGSSSYHFLNPCEREFLGPTKLYQ